MRAAPQGCLAVAIRVPVRIVVFVLVVPARVVWDALVVAGRFLDDVVLRPVGRALAWVGRAVFVWPFVGLWRYAVVPVGRGLAWLGNVLVVVPAGWLYRWTLVPAGHGLAWLYVRVLTPVGHAVLRALRGVGAAFAALGGALTRLGNVLVVVPAVWLYRWVLAPVGRAAAWCVRAVVAGIGVVLYWTARILLVLPALALWRWVLAPVGRVLGVVGREVRDALGHAWRVAGYVSRAVGRFLGTLLRWALVEPVRRAYRRVLTPVGHLVRDTVLRPVAEAGRQALAACRASVRQARADLRRMLSGEPERVPSVDRREPSGGGRRSLGRSTTALTKD
ncbi:hypothetical protein ACLGIH_22870 [Streptomyces sp. HMX87]|uniref:hypothetical protein n=1 Tax=Streptomyces sp. HMX87 TaxID=3390849 RepID=UPI003A8366BF